MSANEESTSVVVTGIFLFALWIVILVHWPLVTILVTFLVAIVAGSIMAGESGDGRNGRR